MTSKATLETGTQLPSDAVSLRMLHLQLSHRDVRKPRLGSAEGTLGGVHF